MYDPFGLSQETPVAAPPTTPGKSHKRYFWVIGVMIGVILLLSAGLYFALRPGVSADVENKNFTAVVKITGLPEELKSSEQFSATISVTDKGREPIRSGYLLIQGYGVNLAETLTLSKNLKSTDSGYLRTLNSDEQALFDEKGESGFYWYIGDLSENQTKSQQIKATVSATGSSLVKIEAKYYTSEAAKTSCGFLGLSRCQEPAGYRQVGYGAATVKLIERAKIKLKNGYNFISLPYVFTTSAAKSFLNSLGGNWAYYYDPTTAGYIDLNSGDNASRIKPGVGFWVKAKAEGEYNLPSPRVETDTNESTSLSLSIGWNHIGNPYPKRIIWSQNDILVQEIGDDGRETGVVYSLKSAIDNQVLSQAFVINYKNFTDSGGTVNDLMSLIEYKALPLGSYLNTSVGVAIQSTKKINLVFPGRSIVAPGDLLSDAEKKKIEGWIISNGLNQFGDPADTAYSSGTPLIDSATGAPIDRYDYIVSKHLDRPWNK